MRRIQDLQSAKRHWSAFGAKPPQPELFDLLRRAGHNLAAAVGSLDELLRVWPEDRGLRAEITRIEHEGDRITHKIVNRLQTSKLTPFDREDAYALAGAIDDVVDDVEEVSEQLAIKHVEAPMDQAQQLAGVLRDSGRALAATLDGLERLERRRGAPRGDPNARARGRPALPRRSRGAVRQRDRPDVRPPLEGHLRCARGRDRQLPHRAATGSRASSSSTRSRGRDAEQSSRADAASSAGRARGGWISSSSGAGWSASSAPTANQLIEPATGLEVEVEPERVDPRALIGGPPARPEVVVDVEEARRGRGPARPSGAARSGGGRRRRSRGRCRGRARRRASRAGGRARGPRAGSPRPSPVPGRPERGSRARA